jgi:hypothetical protein
MPAARQNRSKLADTSSQALPTAPIFVEGNAVGVVLILFMALLSFRGISTPSLPAQGEQRRFFYFNIQRDNPALCAARQARALFDPRRRCRSLTRFVSAIRFGH